jgi:hypothetical protein
MEFASLPTNGLLSLAEGLLEVTAELVQTGAV